MAGPPSPLLPTVPLPAMVVMSCCGLKLTNSLALAALPLASNAVMVKLFGPPCSAIPGTLQDVVPAATPLPPRSLLQRTSNTPTLSAAVPLSLNNPLDVVNVGSVVG